jgi:hypothetical protein
VAGIARRSDLSDELSADDILLGLLALGGSKEMRFNALSRDVHAALLGVKTEFPELRVYSVKQSARTVFEQAVLPLASHSQRAQLTGASKRLWDRLRCNQCE